MPPRPIPDVPVEPFPVSRLDLDPDNVRLPLEPDQLSQRDLVVFFARHYELEELAQSMALHGFISIEPLLTISGAGDRRTVLEGNRRLATLKLLTDANYRDSLPRGRQRFWNDISTVAAANHTFTEIPVRNYSSRNDILDYLGFRHVSGLMQWDADSKARYIFTLITQHGYTFQDAAQAIGSRSDAVRRNFLSWAAVEQGRESGLNLTRAVQDFGVFYRALQNPRMREFIGIDDAWRGNVAVSSEPLTTDGLSALHELVEMIFGSADDAFPPVITDSRQLDRLATIVASDEALAVLRATRSLDLAAQALPSGDDEDMKGLILTAYVYTRRALGSAWQQRGNEVLIAETRKLEQIVEELLRQLLALPERQE